MIFEEPVDAVGFAAFFIGGEGEDEVAVGLESFLVEADKGRNQHGVGVFHVLGAAPVVVAVLLDELEGIGGPVFAAGFDYIFVADEEDGRVGSGTVIADDEVFFAVIRAAEEDVACGKAGVEEALLHGFGNGGDAADRVRAVDIDDLAKDAEGQFFGGGIGGRPGGRGL